MTYSDSPEQGSSTGKEIVVVGAGLVGAVQALLLARVGFHVTVVEQRSLLSSSNDKDNSRTVALSDRAFQLLNGAGLWPAIAHCPIRSVCVTEQGKFGSVKLHAHKLNVEALGYVLANTEFECFLHDLLRREQNITVIESAKVVSVNSTDHQASITVKQSDDGAGNEQLLSADLIIAADGTHSAIRNLLGIDTDDRDYQQCAVLANVSTANPHQHIAFERFTKDGPLALLPLSADSTREEENEKNSHRYSMILTAPLDEKENLEKIPDSDFLGLLQKKFGGQLGRFEKISKRFVAPLKLIVSSKQVDRRFVLIGNAARTLHPVAGQGMNLALRDVFELASCLKGVSTANVCDNGAVSDLDSALKEFVDHRRRDQSVITSQTDILARIFTQKSWPLRTPISLASGLSFFVLDFSDPVKKTFASMNMGRHVPLPGRNASTADRG